MKKLFFVLFLCLLLTACASEQTDPQVDTDETVSSASGLYDPDSTVEQSTNGAVRAYPLGSDHCAEVLTIGNKLLLLSEGKLTLVQGEAGEVAASQEIPAGISGSNMTISCAETGVAYFDEENKQIVLLNPMLQEGATYALPENLRGKPVIDLTQQYAYYFDGQELRALNLQTGISRLIRTFTEEMVELSGVYFDGAVLKCSVTSGESTNTVYLSSQNGQTLSEDQNLYGLQTYENKYFTMRTDGVVTQRIIGGLYDESIISLNLDETAGALVPVLSLNGIVSYLTEETGTQISFYDLASGLKTSALRLEGVTQTIAWQADNQYVWLLAQENEEQVLYRWDLSLSSVEDETVYTGVLYTYQNPNADGLSQLKKRVDEINQAYGVRIAIWEDAMKTSGNYTFKPEHQVSAIGAKLDELEALLSQFPQKFLRSTVQSGWIRICLVRSIESGEEFVQYWSGGDCYGAISINTDIKKAFLMCASYGIDAHVMGNSRDFDTWEQLNPYGFAYGKPVQDEALLAGDRRAFTDAAAGMNLHEDRSRIIAYAMMEGNAEMFASATMQAKLLRACEGIREAYGLEKSTENFIWEQYLN